MERIILYSESPVCRPLPAALGAPPGHEVVGVASPLELARAVIRSGPVLAAVVCCELLGEDLRRLLASMKRSFPLLNLCLVSAADLQAAADDERRWTPVDSRKAPDEVVAQVRQFVAAASRVERRERPRFDWPLQGWLSPPAPLSPPARASVGAAAAGPQQQAHDVWALSVDGAFLESATAPAAGTRATLTILFQNAQLAAACEVLDPRRASSRLPAGFAVRFLQLPEGSRRVIERLVEDALLRTLLELDGGQPEVPTLEEEELSIGGFEPL